MSVKAAKFHLHSLKIDAVRLVPKGANGRNGWLVMKSDDTPVENQGGAPGTGSTPPQPAPVLKRMLTVEKAVELKDGESLSQFATALSDAFYRFMNPSGASGLYVWVSAVYDDFLVAEKDSKLFQFGWTRDDKGEFKFDGGAEVERKTVYVPVGAEKGDLAALLKAADVEMEIMEEAEPLPPPPIPEHVPPQDTQPAIPSAQPQAQPAPAPAAGASEVPPAPQPPASEPPAGQPAPPAAAESAEKAANAKTIMARHMIAQMRRVLDDLATDLKEPGEQVDSTPAPAAVPSFTVTDQTAGATAVKSVVVVDEPLPSFRMPAAVDPGLEALAAALAGTDETPTSYQPPSAPVSKADQERAQTAIDALRTGRLGAHLDEDAPPAGMQSVQFQKGRTGSTALPVEGRTEGRHASDDPWSGVTDMAAEYRRQHARG